MNKARSEQGNKTIALNKKARRDYFIEDRIEAGLCLQGREAKSPRAGKIQIIDSYILLKNGKACLFGALMSPLPAAAKHVEADPQRNRKLLPHRAELNKLIGANPVWSIPAMRDFHDKASVRRAGRPDTSSLACLWRWLKRPARAKISRLSKTALGRCRALVICYCLALLSLPATAQSLKQVAVATAHPQATRVGIDILRRGGNAFDAAAAVTASLGVVEPYGSGLGGGGFWLIHRASDGKQLMIDGREKAPLAAHKDIYLDKSGNVIKGMSLNGPTAAAIPGTPAAIERLVKKYGRLSLKEVLAPAIRQARAGFLVTERYRKWMKFRTEVIKDYPETAAIFLRNGQIPALGERIVQADLANTLEMIAEQGSRSFYSGRFADKLVQSVRENGGFWVKRDLLNYRLVEREPVRLEYNGIRVSSAPPPSSGGIVMGQILNMLAHYDLPRLDSAARKHILAEAMRRAYRDRAAYLGDADFVEVPVERLMDKDYAEGLALTIDMARATPSAALGDIAASNPAGESTTHFSIVDAEGNRVAATLSINFPFGSGFVAAGAGVLLNNEMDDFSIKPGSANAYGLVGSQANAIAPGKRPLSSMTPTFVETDEAVAVLGTPGGSRIISMVLLGVLDFAAGGLPESWVSLPRFHHQYLPDRIQYESGGMSDADRQALKARGHELDEMNRQYGNMQAVMLWKKKNLLFAASDPRGEGRAKVIYINE